MDISLLISPSEGVTRDSRFSSNRKMAEWVESLPLANVAESTRELTLAFEELRRLRASDSVRYSFLEKTGPFLHTFFDEFERSLDLRQFPLSRVTVETAERTVLLEAAMVANYRLVMGDRGQGRIGLKALARRRQLTASFRVVQYLGKLLTICRRLHFPLPDDAWQTLFRAYATGRRIARGPAAASFDTEFRYHLAMALIRPDDYPPAEFEPLRQLVARLASQHGCAGVSGAVGEHLFPLDLDRNSGPSRYPTEEERGGKPNRFVLDLSGPVSQLRAALAASKSPMLDIEGIAISRYAGQRIVDDWTRSDGHRDERTAENRSVRLIKGISAVASVAASREMVGVAVEDVDVKMELRLDDSPRWIAEFRRETDVKTDAGVVLDRSESGLGIALPTPRTEYAVGELVAVDQDDGMVLTVVRWIRDDGSRGLKMGLRKLCSDVFTRQVRIGREDSQSQPIPALLCRRCDGQPAIMLPNLSAYRRRGVTVHYGARSLRLASERLLDMASGFELFELDGDDFEQLMEIQEQPEAEDEMELIKSFEEALSRRATGSSQEPPDKAYALRSRR